MRAVWISLTRPHPWGLVWIVWMILTIVASSFSVNVPGDRTIEIPHLDKLMHFGWFFAGGYFLMVALLFRSDEVVPKWARIIFPVLFISAFGALDEFRQSFTPGRNGNDLGDWLADSLGGLSGSLLALHTSTMLRAKLIRMTR